VLKDLGKKKIIRSSTTFRLIVVGVILAAIFFAFQGTGTSFYLTASWYDTEGVMANGQRFYADGLTCATNLFPFGSRLLITDFRHKHSVKVTVTDRINKRFTFSRIDLTPRAFIRLIDLEQGTVPVRVQRILN
jgi:rare lipoprotein A (peptidoglycan hydrolase)